MVELYFWAFKFLCCPWENGSFAAGVTVDYYWFGQRGNGEENTQRRNWKKTVSSGLWAVEEGVGESGVEWEKGWFWLPPIKANSPWYSWTWQHQEKTPWQTQHLSYEGYLPTVLPTSLLVGTFKQHSEQHTSLEGQNRRGRTQKMPYGNRWRDELLSSLSIPLLGNPRKKLRGHLAKLVVLWSHIQNVKTWAIIIWASKANVTSYYVTSQVIDPRKYKQYILLIWDSLNLWVLILVIFTLANSLKNNTQTRIV